MKAPLLLKLPLAVVLSAAALGLGVVGAASLPACATTSDPLPRAAAIEVPEASSPAATRSYVRQNYAVQTGASPNAVCAEAQDRVYFDAGSDEMGANATSFLDMVVACMDSTSLRDKELLIIGYAQPTEHVEPETLGLYRAQTVASYLQAQGLSHHRFEVRSAGTTHVYDDTPRHPNGRRVDLKIVDSADRAARQLLRF